MGHMADLSWNIHTLLKLLSLADLVRDLVTLLPVNIATFLLRNILADWVSNKLLVSLLHILALIIRVLLACGLDGSPDLGVALYLPLVLTVLLVQGHTFSLSVRLVHSLVLVNTDLLVHSFTDLVLDNSALLLCSILAQSLALQPALLLIVGLALLHSLHLVLSVPDSGVVGGTHQGWLLLGDLGWHRLH
eukprot:TRINITY_DN1234_c0_g1_i1.p1 TRINITY_DN1234_c0_g1~~TRINITY_DN1234_c0_g1_i1.p1  ORF type:complete len:190 (+),score=20.18 TRINITY_DN1234_c0_g1_i1:247-816(+)